MKTILKIVFIIVCSFVLLIVMNLSIIPSAIKLPKIIVIDENTLQPLQNIVCYIEVAVYYGYNFFGVLISPDPVKQLSIANKYNTDESGSIFLNKISYFKHLHSYFVIELYINLESKNNTKDSNSFFSRSYRDDVVIENSNYEALKYNIYNDNSKYEILEDPIYDELYGNVKHFVDVNNVLLVKLKQKE